MKLEPDFTAIPNYLFFEDPKINNITLFKVFRLLGKKHTALFNLYFYLYSCVGHLKYGYFKKRFYRPIKIIAIETGLDEATISKHLGTLEALGLIRVFRRSWDKDDSRCSEYMVNYPTQELLRGAYIKALNLKGNKKINIQITEIVKKENLVVADNMPKHSPGFEESDRRIKEILGLKRN